MPDFVHNMSELRQNNHPLTRVLHAAALFKAHQKALASVN